VSPGECDTTRANDQLCASGADCVDAAFEKTAWAPDLGAASPFHD
jgi:hypothetical protein